MLSAALAATASETIPSFSAGIRFSNPSRSVPLPVPLSSLSRVEGKELITIVNAGPGIAKGVLFLVVQGPEWCQGLAPAPDSFLMSGEGAMAQLHFTGAWTGQNIGVVVCRDHLERAHWTLEGRHHVFLKFSWRARKRIPYYPGPEAALRTLYPEREEADLSTRREVSVNYNPDVTIPRQTLYETATGDVPDRPG